MTKSSQLCSIHQENTRKSCLQLNLIILTDYDSFAVNEDKLQKISQFSRFLLRSGYAIKFKIRKQLKLLNSVPFIMKTLVYNWTWSFWLTFPVLKLLKTNFKNWSIFKISAKVRICDFGQIWKWLKLLNSVPFIMRTLVNHVYIRIWSFCLTFTVLQWM